MIRETLLAAWRLALTAFFRRIYIEGLENLPRTGPLLLTPNHTNAFVDAFLISTAVPRRVTLTAKSTLFRHPVLRVLLRAIGAVALHRQRDRDQGADPAANIEALAECRRRLSRGEAICIFPEGISHSDSQLRPLRSGAARIALDFIGAGQGSLMVVPVGLVYEAKEKFRSAVWIRFGSPLDVAGWAKEHPDAGARELSDEIERRLRAITLNFRRRRESLLFQWTAELLATRGLPPLLLSDEDSGEGFRERASLASLIGDGYPQLETTHRESIGELEDRIRRYHGDLRRFGISPSEVYLEMNAGRAALFVVREIETLLIGLPLALIAVLLLGPAYWLTRTIVQRISVDRDHWATNAIGIGAMVIPLFAAIELAAAWTLFSWPFALAFTVLLPYCGYYALLYRDRAGGVLRRSRTFLRFLFHPSLQRRLETEGRAIIAGIENLGSALSV